jgi:polar amino acid transport system substrate-binding protein
MSSQISKAISFGVVAAVALLSQIGPGASQSLQAIRHANTIAIGVKADSKPWGYLDPQGRPIGFEIDLAYEIARRIGVQPKLTVVTSANRIQLLEQGLIDVILATMSDTPERRRVVHMVEPFYYADLTNLLVPSNTAIKKWDDVNGRKICGVQGSLYNRWLEQNYKAQVIAFAGLTETFAAFKQGLCDGVVYADQILRETTADKAIWGAYSVGLEAVNEIPWAIAVRKSEADSDLSKVLGETINEMHRTGALIAIAKKWGLEENAFLVRVQMSAH